MPSVYRDLTHPIETGMQTVPGDPSVELTPVATVPEDGVGVHELSCGSHTGTHIDAPNHMLPDGGSLGERDVGDFVFDAYFLDVTPCAPGEPIGSEALPSEIPDHVDLLVLRTGWAEHWGTDEYLEHPYASSALGEHLREADCGIALDTLSPDPTLTAETAVTSPRFPVHHELLGADLPIIENLTNGEGLPTRFTLYAFPLPIDCDGAPVRAVARTGDT